MSQSTVHWFFPYHRSFVYSFCTCWLLFHSLLTCPYTKFDLQVDFSPTLERLASMVNNVAEGLTVCAGIIQRLPDLLTRTRSQKEPIFVVIENDEETRKVQQNIKTGMASNAMHLVEYLKTWDNYREIYEISKDAFIRRYQRLSPPVSSFDGDIQRYVRR